MLAAALVPGAACGPAVGVAPTGTDDPAPAIAIQLDGDLSDWTGLSPLQEDLDDAAGEPRVDLEALYAWDDPAWLYFSLEVDGQLNLQSMPGTIHLLLDLDANPTTGSTVRGITGVELELRLSERRPPRAGGELPEYGGGFGASWWGARENFRAAATGATSAGQQVLLADLGVTSLPTYSSERFEMRIRRDLAALPGSPVLGGQIRVAVVAESSQNPDEEVEPGEPSADAEVESIPAEDFIAASVYRFANAPGPDPVTPSLAGLEPPTDSATFRVATWNVGEGSFRSPEDHARILAAVHPDVILLDEVYDGITDEALTEFFASPGLAELGDWEWAVALGGGRQKTLVATRDRELRQLGIMEEVQYAPGAVNALKLQVPEPFYRALDYEAEVNMSATGVTVEVIPGAQVLFVPVDLQSGGYDGSPQDVLRLLQAQTLVRHLRQVRELRGSIDPGGVHRLVLAGDLNLVGSRAPLDALTRGQRSPFGQLVVADLPRVDDGTPVTWRGRHPNPFAPGRLDYTLFSGETLEQVGGFTFATDALTDEQLARLGLEQETSETTSDHLVMVADFRVQAR